MRAFSLVLSFVLITAATDAAEPELAPEQIEALIRDLPKPEVLRRYQRIVWDDPSKHNAEVVARAKAEVARASEIIPTLRKTLVVGTSVFAYPGLIAHGDITCFRYSKTSVDPFVPSPEPEPEPERPPEWGYRLHLGIPAIGGEGPHHGDFVVVFDSSGLIRAVKDQKALKR